MKIEILTSENDQQRPTTSAVAIDLDVQLLPHKCCPICRQGLPIIAFGVCLARKDGRNLYCKSCVRQKVTDSRNALRTYRQRRRELRQVSLPQFQLAPVSPYNTAGILRQQEIANPERTHEERVLGAIYYGARTWLEIVNAIRVADRPPIVALSSSSSPEVEAVGDSLATLSFCHPPKITSLKVGSERVYAIAPLPAERPISEPRSFSTIGLLHPVIGGRNKSPRRAA